MNDQTKPGLKGDLSEMGRALSLICRATAFSAEAFLHRGFGRGYMGVQSGMVPAIIIFFSLLWSGHNPLPLYAFAAAYLAACFAAAIRLAKRVDDETPELYSGWPTLMRSFFFLKEETVKRVVEPIWVLLLGLAITIFNVPLGVYLMFVAAALVISTNFQSSFGHARVLELPDQTGTTRQEIVQIGQLPAPGLRTADQPESDSESVA